MCPRSAAASRFIMKACISVDGQNNVTGTVKYNIVRVGVQLVKKCGHIFIESFSYTSLLCANIVEGHKQLIII